MRQISSLSSCLAIRIKSGFTSKNLNIPHWTNGVNKEIEDTIRVAVAYLPGTNVEKSVIGIDPNPSRFNEWRGILCETKQLINKHTTILKITQYARCRFSGRSTAKYAT